VDGASGAGKTGSSNCCSGGIVIVVE